MTGFELKNQLSQIHEFHNDFTSQRKWFLGKYLIQNNDLSHVLDKVRLSECQDFQWKTYFFLTQTTSEDWEYKHLFFLQFPFTFIKWKIVTGLKQHEGE